MITVSWCKHLNPVSHHIACMDNYDRLLFKPIMEQPDYVPEEYLRMQRSGVLRYTPSCIHFGPSYFK